MYKKEITVDFLCDGRVTFDYPFDNDFERGYIEKRLKELIESMNSAFAEDNAGFDFKSFEVVSVDWVEAYEEYRDPALEDGEEM